MTVYNTGQVLKWEDGIIGKIESHFKSRFPVKPLAFRLVGATLVSIPIRRLVLRNKLGDCTGNIYTGNITPTGGFKSPYLKLFLKLLRHYYPELILPSKFTVVAMLDVLTGKKAQKEIDEVIKQSFGIIVREEASTLIIDSKNQNYEDVIAFLCQAWDNHVDSAQTRSRGLTGGVDTYICFVFGANEHFLTKMDSDDFWIIGLGARVLFVSYATLSFGKYGDDFFEKDLDKTNEENKVFEETKAMLHKLENEGLHGVQMCHPAMVLWENWEYELRQTYDDPASPKYDTDPISRAQKAKMAQQVLRLAIDYSASVFSIDNRILMITEECMKKAIDDVTECYTDTMRIVNVWRKKREENTITPTVRIPVVFRHIIDYLTWMVLYNGGLTSGQDICDNVGAANVTEVRKVLERAKEMGYLKVVAMTKYSTTPSGDNKLDQGELTAEEYAKFNSKPGTKPQIYRITGEGKVFLRTKGVNC
jgi:hypothetical protein